MRRPSDIPASPLASNTNRMESEAREELCSSDEEEVCFFLTLLLLNTDHSILAI